MLQAHGIDLTAGTEIEVNTLENSMWFRSRGKRPKKIVVDWSGNEMNAEEYASFLAKGKTGTHLFIDHEGYTWQFADLFRQVSRWKGVDDVAVWITLQNKGIPPADPRVSRGVFVYEFGPFKNPVLAVNADQLEALVDVVELICRSIGIAPNIPRKNGEPVTRQLKPATVKMWEGLLLSAHVGPTMSPGPGVLGALDDLEQELLAEDDEDDEDDTDLDGEEQEVNEGDFERDFPDPG